MNLAQIKPYLEKPTPLTPGKPLFWDDPYISAQILKNHLDPTKDLASRRPEVIDRSVAWLVEILGLQPRTLFLIWFVGRGCMPPVLPGGAWK